MIIKFEYLHHDKSGIFHIKPGYLLAAYQL